MPEQSMEQVATRSLNNKPVLDEDVVQKVEQESPGPMFEHPCPNCKFLGQLEDKAEPGDLYLHTFGAANPNGEKKKAVVFRYANGDDTFDTMSLESNGLPPKFVVANPDSPLVAAERLAREKNLLPPSTFQ